MHGDATNDRNTASPKGSSGIGKAGKRLGRLGVVELAQVDHNGAVVGLGRDVRMAARARWSALLIGATEVSRVSATSATDQPNTSVRIRAARCFGGKCWRRGKIVGAGEKIRPAAQAADRKVGSASRCRRASRDRRWWRCGVATFGFWRVLFHLNRAEIVRNEKDFPAHLCLAIQ